MATDSKKPTQQLLFEASEQLGLTPSWLVPGLLFAIQTNQGEAYVDAARSPLNTTLSSRLAQDKFVTRLILERHGLPNIPYMRAETHEEAYAFLQTHQTIIAKPLRGSGSRNIHVVTEPSQLSNLRIRNFILEKYVRGTEVRYLLLNEEIIAVHHSHYGVSVQEDRYLERISIPKHSWNEEQTSLALAAAQAVGLRFAAVDFIIDETNTAHILEINSAPGMKWFHAPTSGPITNIAHLFMTSVLENIEPKVSGVR